jgi:hypothetical protein
MPGHDEPSTELEQSVEKVESRLLALGEALRVHRAEAVEAEAAELQRALAAGTGPDEALRSDAAGVAAV